MNILLGEQESAEFPRPLCASAFLLVFSLAFISLGEVRVLREDLKGIEILYLNRTPLPSAGLPMIEEGRRVGDYPFPAVEVFVGIPQEGDISLFASGEDGCFWEGEIPADCGGNPLPEVIPQKPLAEIRGIEYLRDVRFARVVLFPIHLLDKEGPIWRLKVYNRIRLSINYSSPPKLVDREDHFDDVYEFSFINGKRARLYKKGGKEEGGGYTRNFFSTSLNWVKVKVDSTGIYKVTAQDLRGIGINPFSIDPRTLKVYHIGKFVPNRFYPDTMAELPIYVRGEEDGRFDEEDFILFYGERLKSLYTSFNCYWLTFGIGHGRRMGRYLGLPLPASPLLTCAQDSIRFEVDALCPGRSGLLWLWEYFAKARGEERSYQKKLSLPQAKALKRLTIAFCPTLETARLRLLLNGVFFDSLVFFRRQGEIGFVYRRDTTLLISEELSLEFVLYGERAQEFYLDYIEVIYEKDLSRPGKEDAVGFTLERIGDYNVVVRALKRPLYLFEIIPDTVAFRPEVKMVEGFSLAGESLVFGKTFCYRSRFLLVSEKGIRRPLGLEVRFPYRLRNPNFSAHYLIVTPDEFLRQAQVLRGYRQNNIKDLRAARAEVATLSHIYDEYSFGIEEPGAIKKFLSDKRPYYAVLVGDATYDYRSLLPYKRSPGVPTYECGYEFLPETAFPCDAWYADLEGEGTSPDVILSRLPVRDEQEFKRFISKLISFERRGAEENQRFLVIGDDEFKGCSNIEDEIHFGTHIHQCEGIVSLFGQNFEPVKVYLTEYPFRQHGDKPKAKEAILQAINTGVALKAYFGHGHTITLSHENVLTISDLTKIRNSERPFFGFYGSCNVGRFDDTRNECLAEELSRMEGGAIATVAASKGTYPSPNYYFAQTLFAPLVTYRSGIIGKGFLAAWPIEKTYHLFGCGATNIRLARRSFGLSASPETLKPGEIIRLTVDSARTKEGYCQITAYGPKTYRHYICLSTAQPSRYRGLTMSYILPGEIVAKGRSPIKEGRIEARFMFPKFPYPETRYVENGRYVQLPNSARIRVLALGRDSGVYYIRDSIPFLNQEALSSDSIGPEITLYYQKRELKDGDRVEREFNLEGRLYDESGISLISHHPLGFYINNQEDFQDLRDKIVFDYSSFQRAHFNLPLRLSAPCSLVFILSDNLGNQTRKRINLDIVTDTDLLLKDAWYVSYGGSGYFTFSLNFPAFVTIKIYTISGRFLKEIRSWACLGFNKVYFDGCDSQGRRLGRGLYLYRIDAQTLHQKRANLIEKFVIR